MDLSQVSQQLKSLPDELLQRVIQSGQVPEFMVLSEMQDRQRMRAAAQAQRQPQGGTVAQSIMSGGQPQGGPPQGGQAPQPQQAPQGYAAGGPVGGGKDGHPQVVRQGGPMRHFAEGGAVDDKLDPAAIAAAAGGLNLDPGAEHDFGIANPAAAAATPGADGPTPLTWENLSRVHELEGQLKTPRYGIFGLPNPDQKKAYKELGDLTKGTGYDMPTVGKLGKGGGKGQAKTMNQGGPVPGPF